MANFISRVQTPSGIMEVSHDTELSDEELIKRAEEMARLQTFKITVPDIEPVQKEEETEENLLADLAQSASRVGAGPLELARDIVNTAGRYAGADDDLISDKFATSTKASFIDAMFGPLGVEPSDVLTEEGEYKDPTTTTGVVTNIVPFFVGTNIAKTAVSKALPKLGEVTQYTIGGALAEQALYGGDGVIADLFVDPNDPTASVAKDIIEFLAIQEDDTALEERLKVAFEGLAIGGVLGLFMKPFTAKTGLELKGSAEEQVEQTVEGLKKLRKEKQRSNKNVHADLKFSETPETLAQIDQQRSNPIMRWGRQFFTSRGHWTPGAYNAVRGKEYAERQTVREAENIANRLKITLDRLDYDLPEENVNAFLAGLGEPNLKTRVPGNLNQARADGTITDTEFKDEAYALAKKLGIPRIAADELLNARELIDTLSARLMNSQIPNEQLKEVIGENVGQYINRSYRIYEDTNFKPDENLKEQVIQRIADSFEDLLNDEGLPLSQSEIARRVQMSPEDRLVEATNIVENILDKRTGFAGLDHYSKAVRLNKGILQGKKDIDDDIRLLMGEITDPVDNIVLTVGKLSNLVETNAFASNLLQAGKGKYFFTKPFTRTDKNGNVIKYDTPVKGTNTVLDGYKQKFEVDGEPRSKTTVYYTTPEMAEAIAGRQSHSDFFDHWVFQNYAALKGGSQAMKTVASHVTHLRNMLGGMQFGIANGINPFYGGGNSFEVLVNAAKNSGDKELDELYERYLGLGVINTNVKVQEFRRLMQMGAEGVQQPSELMSKLGSFNYGVPKVVAEPIKSGLGKSYRAAEKLYVAVDDFYKINAFEKELEFLKKAKPNVSAKELEKEAAVIIQNTFPNYDKVSPGIKAFRYLPMGSFVSFPTEILRTSYHIMRQGAREMLSGNATLMRRGTQRLAGFGTSMAAWDYLAEKGAMLAGLTQEEKEAIQEVSHTPWSKAVRIPFRDESGQLFAADTQFLNSYSTLQEPARELMFAIEQGQLKEEEALKYISQAVFNAGWAVLRPYAQEAIIVDALTDIGGAFASYINDGDGRTRDGQQLFAKGRLEEGLIDSFGLMLQTMLPGTITSAKGLYEANLFDLRGEVAIREGTGTPKRDLGAELLANTTGIKFSKIDPTDTVFYRAQDFSRLEESLANESMRSDRPAEDTKEVVQDNIVQRYKAQQELYLTASRAIELVGYGPVYDALSQHMSRDKAATLLSNIFSTSEYMDRKADDIWKSRDTSTKAKEILLEIQEEELKYRYTPLIPVEELSRAELERRATRAKGGVVLDVPQVPVEPDERIDKMTGRPYNEQAGEAFTDEEDRIALSKGSALVKGLTKIFGKQADEARNVMPAPQRAKDEPAVNRELAEEDYVDFRSSFEAIEDPKDWQSQVKEAVEQNRDINPVVITPELEESAKQFEAGLITRGEHLENIEMFKPIREYTNLTVDPTNKELVFSLKPDQRADGQFVLDTKAAEGFGVSKAELAIGDKFNGRLDIPAYKFYDTWIIAGTSKPGRGTTYAKAVHYEGKDGKPVRFLASEAKGMRILKGEDEKTGYATVSGWVKDLDAEKIRKQAELYLNDPAWTQVGFDPRRQTSFYVREEGKLKGVPVTEADEVIQIGPLVLAKNVVMDLEKTSLSSGGITRRFAVAKGGKIDKKKMACNKPKRTASHPKKSHVVKACKDGKEKIIRFGEQGAKTAGKPKAGESKRMKAKRKSFKARHGRNIKKGNMSAAYWADKVKW
tara:strand:- start:393 stop:5591 length:5199 start_codon:yes stop_codon:yes gene_type:complete